MRKPTVLQPFSATRAADRAGLRHDSKSVVEVTVGATPTKGSSRTSVHFCSSRLKVHTMKRGGRGTVPETSVCFPNGLPVLCNASILRFDAIVVSNGSLRICSPTNVRAVTIPRRLLDHSPWAYDGGAEDVASSLGCRTLDEMFEKHGEVVQA